MSTGNIGELTSQGEPSKPEILSRVATFSEPDSGQVEEVLYNPNFPGFPEKLCTCEGTMTGESGELLCSVYFKNVAGKDVAIPVADVLTSPYCYDAGFKSLELPVGWEYPTEILAYQGEAGAELWNTIRAVGVVYHVENGVLEPINSADFPTSIISYKGQGVETCSPSARFAGGQDAAIQSKCSAMSAARAGLSASFVPSPTDRGPVERDGEWLLYRGLSVSEFGRGSRLMQHGEPLKGRTVAFAAADVRWRRGQRLITYIDRAAGEPIAATGLVFSAGAPLSSVMVWQVNTPQHRSVIASECRNAPVVLNLDGDDDIYVQVNFDFMDAKSRSGGFDLWVRVID